MIEVRSLTKNYGTFNAVSDLSFSVRPGEILGFLGPNGAGKTTTMRILTGYFPPTRGEVKIAGHDIITEPLQAKSKTGYLPESPPLYDEMTVVEYMNFVAQIKGINSNKLTTRVNETLERCSLTKERNQLTGTLSKGYRQRVGIAQALVHNPAVLLLDEPTAGLDPAQIGETRQLIKSLGGDHTVLLSTHILPEVSVTCDRVAIINNGRLLAQGTPESLQEQFRQTKHLQLTIQGNLPSIKKVLLETKGVLGLEVKSQVATDITSLLVKVDAQKDIRRHLSSRIIENELGLLEQKQNDMSLEETYLRAISQEDS